MSTPRASLLCFVAVAWQAGPHCYSPVNTSWAYRAAHPGGSAGDLLAAIQTDWYWRMPALRLAEAHAKRGASTYMYEFAWRSPQFNDRLACLRSTGSDPPQQLPAMSKRVAYTKRLDSKRTVWESAFAASR